jgi:hypothetical protein
MNERKYITIIAVVCFLQFMPGAFIGRYMNLPPGNVAFAESEQYYTSDEEFLPLGVSASEDEKEKYKEFLEDEGLIKNAKIGGIKLLKDKRQFIFTITADNIADLENKDLKYDIFKVNFPPRVIVQFYGVKSEEKVYHFFKNLDILGLVLNPFKRGYATEYVIFFRNWIDVNAVYAMDEKRFVLEYEFSEPDFTKGYGVRIADTKIDPLPQVVEIQHELIKYGLDCYLLIASDNETIVLESPFYATKDEAVAYIESLHIFGFKGKLAIREYRDFPKPHRFDVVSETVITAEDRIDLKNIIYGELEPQKIYKLSYSDIYILTRDIFSPQIRNTEENISEYYYKFSELYRDFETDSKEIREMALVVSVKILELIYFNYPDSQRADDSLWEVAQTAADYKIVDVLSEEECYRKIVDEYPESLFAEEARARLGAIEAGGNEL